MKPGDIQTGSTYRSRGGYDHFILWRKGPDVGYRIENAGMAGREGTVDAVELANRLDRKIPNYTPLIRTFGEEES